jgi:hypothetical protein
MTDAAEHVGCRSRLCGVTCGEHHDEASGRELPAHFESNATVGPGNQHYPYWFVTHPCGSAL